jgi:hypothetical protein
MCHPAARRDEALQRLRIVGWPEEQKPQVLILRFLEVSRSQQLSCRLVVIAQRKYPRGALRVRDRVRVHCGAVTVGRMHHIDEESALDRDK